MKRPERIQATTESSHHKTTYGSPNAECLLSNWRKYNTRRTIIFVESNEFDRLMGSGATRSCKSHADLDTLLVAEAYMLLSTEIHGILPVLSKINCI